MRDQEWRTADLNVRKVAALQAQARWGRQVADQDLASISIEPNLWPTSAVIDWFDLLKRAPDLSERDKRMQEAEQILRSRLNFQGTTMGFSTERTDFLWWLMISGDVNANRLAARDARPGSWRRGHAAPGARQPGTAAARPLEHDGRQRVGCAGDGEIRRGLREGAGERRDLREARRSRPSRSTGASTPKGEELMFSWPQGRGDPRPGARWRRHTVGDGAEPRRDSAAAAVLVRLPDQAHGFSGGAEASGQVVARRCHARAPGPRSAVRHELGRGQRSGPGRCERARHRAWAATPRSWRRARSSRVGCGRRSRSASSTRFAPTTASCRKANGRSSTRCG